MPTDKRKENDWLKVLWAKLLYFLIGGVVFLLLKLLCGYRIKTDDRIRAWKKRHIPFVVLCAHPSEMDAAVLVTATWPNYSRIVAGERQLYRPGLGWLFRAVRLIPKRQFLPDTAAVREMMRTIKKGMILSFMPEGRISMDGTESPVDISVAKLLKKLNVPAALLLPSGSYQMMSPYKGGLSFGPIRADFQVLMDEGEAEQLSVDDIFDRIRTRLHYNDPETACRAGWKYGTQCKVTRDVSKLFYRCPKCGSYRTVSDDGRGCIRCSACNAELTADRSMRLASAEKGMPENIAEWNGYQLCAEENFWRDPNSVWRTEAAKSVLEHLTDKDFTACGSGELTVTHEGVCYDDGTDRMMIPLASLSGVSADYKLGTITVYRPEGVFCFTFDDARGTAQFVNSLMVLRKLYL